MKWMALFQLVIWVPGYTFSVTDYVWGQDQEIHVLPQREVFKILHRHGFLPCQVSEDKSVGKGASNVFVATKL